MLIRDILKKQISVSYSNSNIKFEKEIIGIDIENCGRLYVNENLEIHILFEKPLHSDERLVQLFFKPRISSEYMRIYISKIKFQAYRKTNGTKPITNLEKAMEYFSVFKSIYESLTEFISYK
jgi:hypothetical protein